MGETSTALQVTVENSGATAIPITSVNVTAPFALANNAMRQFARREQRLRSVLDICADAGWRGYGNADHCWNPAEPQTVQLSGTGASPPTDTLSPSSLTFSGTIIGSASPAQTVTLTNSGGVPLTSISATASGPFQVSSNCGTQLAGGASCARQRGIRADRGRRAAGKLSVSDLLKTQTVALTGTGLLPPAIGVSPASFSFPRSRWVWPVHPSRLL